MTQLTLTVCDNPECGAKMDSREEVTYVEWKPPGVERFQAHLCEKCRPKLEMLLSGALDRLAGV